MQKKRWLGPQNEESFGDDETPIPSPRSLLLDMSGLGDLPHNQSVDAHGGLRS